MVDLSDKPWQEFSLDNQPDDRISPNFKIYELTKSDVADRAMIDNRFTDLEHLQCAVYLCRNVLQIVRNEFGRFSPNSEYRSQQLERVLKHKPGNWESTSQHTKGQACDIEVPGIATMDLALWISQNLTFDQIICECYNPAKGPNSGWVHVSLVPPDKGQNRGKLLSYVYDPGGSQYVYVEGLRASA